MLQAQKFLLDRSPAELFQNHGVKVVPAYDDAGNVVLSLNYDQLASKTSDALVRECRGTVIRPVEDRKDYNPHDPVGDTVVLARPMRRFLNLGEGRPEDQFDITDPSAVFETKEDGTLCFVYFDPKDNRWHVGTRNMARGQGRVGSLTRSSFRELFEETSGKPLDEFAQGFDKDHTYSFELTTPFNEVGVAQDCSRVTLLAVRHNVKGTERDSHEVASYLGLDSPKCHRHASVTELLNWVHAQPAKRFEGLVVKLWDENTQGFRRMKVKSRNYVAAAHSKRDTVQSPRSILALILGNQWDDVSMTLNPAVRAVGDSIQNRLRDLCRNYDTLYETHVDTLEGTADRKTVATALHTNGIPIQYGFARRENPSLTYVDFLREQGKSTVQNPNGWKDSLLTSVLKTLGV